MPFSLVSKFAFSNSCVACTAAKHTHTSVVSNAAMESVTGSWRARMHNFNAQFKKGDVFLKSTDLAEETTPVTPGNENTRPASTSPGG